MLMSSNLWKPQTFTDNVEEESGEVTGYIDHNGALFTYTFFPLGTKLFQTSVLRYQNTVQRTFYNNTLHLAWIR
jgi:hypothetical protein